MAQRTPKQLDRNALMNFAAQALSARALTISELREKLKRRAAEPLDVDAVVAHLKDAGYLNDQRFADSYASWRRDEGGFGKTRVFRDLMNRRVAPAVAKQAAFLQRKYRGKDLGMLLKEEKQLASAYRKLRTSGFSTGNSIKVLKRYAAQAELLEESEEEPL